MAGGPTGVGATTGGGSVTLNGAPASLAGVDAHTSALDWVRARGLTGAKEACAEGGCGACAVLLARPGTSTPTTWVAVNACLIPAAALAGQEVVTVEGLGVPGALHPVQRELAERGGTQCGYCTPGVVCSMAAEYYRPAPDGFDLDALSGNLCRCTGYRPIREAALALGAPEPGDPMAARTQEPPPVPTMPGTGRGAGLVRPADLAQALRVLAEHPEAVVVAGSTDWGVAVNLRGARAPLLAAVDRLPELRELVADETRITIGAALTLTEVQHRLAGRVPLLAAMLPRFGSRLVRNSATLGGNLATASPVGDSAPVLLALGAEVVLASADGQRVVAIEEFVTGYRQTVLRPGELIVAVRVPQPQAALTWFEKVTKRRVDDIASVTVALALDVEDGRVGRARIGLGGVAATPVRARTTEQALLGHPWDAATVERAASVLSGEGSPLDDHRASAAYRRAMLGQALRRLHAMSGPQLAMRQDIR